jgi:hypothetical protein
MLEDEHGEFSYYWLGKIEPEPERTFEVVDISHQANADLAGENDVEGVPAWTEQGPENDLSCIETGRIERHGVPLEVIDPADNESRACIGLGTGEGYRDEAALTIGRKAGCLYIHHCTAGSGQPVGWVTLQYADGTERRVYVQYGKHVKNWWGPTDVPYNRREGWVCRTAWTGFNEQTHVGTYVWGLDNPEPGKVIEQVRFTHSGAGHTWFVLGLTLSDAPRYFEPPSAHGGWLVNWNSAGVVYALLEGLAGIVDEGLAYDRVRLSPRWAAAGVDHVTACAKYEASGAYVRYRYERRDDELTLELAGNGEDVRLEIMLPADLSPARVTVNGCEAEFELRDVADARYLCLEAPGLAVCTVTVLGE